MAKADVRVRCTFCGANNSFTEKEFATLGVAECSDCESEFELPTEEELTEHNNGALEIAEQVNTATHCRIMVQGEDGQEFTVKNNVRKDDELFEFALLGIQQAYPEGRVFTEDEETTCPGYMRMLMDDRHCDYEL